MGILHNLTPAALAIQILVTIFYAGKFVDKIDQLKLTANQLEWRLRRLEGLFLDRNKTL